jgi:hypothetical protein
MLRHSMATRLVNAGVPIKTIADVLAHTSIDTTAIYTKVDVTRLAMAALPFPTGGGRCAARLEEYVALRRRLGFQFKTQADGLIQFDRFVHARRHEGPMTA